MFFLFNCKLYLKWSKFLCNFTAWVCIKTQGAPQTALNPRFDGRGMTVKRHSFFTKVPSNSSPPPPPRAFSSSSSSSLSGGREGESPRNEFARASDVSNLVPRFSLLPVGTGRRGPWERGWWCELFQSGFFFGNFKIRKKVHGANATALRVQCKINLPLIYYEYE